MSLFNDVLKKVRSFLPSRPPIIVKKKEEKKKGDLKTRLEKRAGVSNVRIRDIDKGPQKISVKNPQAETKKRIDTTLGSLVRERSKTLDQRRQEAIQPRSFREGVKEVKESTLRGGRLARDIGQTVAQSVVSTGLQLEDKNRRVQAFDDDSIRGKVGRAVFGEKEIGDFDFLGESVGTDLGFSPEFVKNNRFVIGATIAGLDLTNPVPGKRKIAKEVIGQLVRKYGDETALAIAKTGDSKLAQNALRDGGRKAVQDAGIQLPVKPTLVKGKTLGVDDLNLSGDDFDTARRRVSEGKFSQTEGNIRVTPNNKGKFDVLDGNHRVVQGIDSGKDTFKVDIELKDKRILSPTPEAKQVATKIDGARARNIPDREIAAAEKTFLKSSDGNVNRATRKEATEFNNALDTVKAKIPTTTQTPQRAFKNVLPLSYFRRPQKVFNKIGIGNESAALFKAFDNMRMFQQRTKASVRNWQKELGINRLNAGTGVRKFQSQRMFDASDTGNVNLLNKEERVVAERARRLMDDLADRVDAANKKVGKPPMNRRENYITNILTETSRLVIKDTKQVPNELLSVLQHQVPENIVNNLLKERTGTLAIQKDFWKALNSAIDIHSKYAFLEPEIHAMSQVMKSLGDSLPVSARKYVNSRLNSFVGRPGSVRSSLRGIDESITKFLSESLPFNLGKKKVAAQFKNNVEFLVDVPRFQSKIAERGLDTLKSFKYAADLGLSTSFFITNLTQPFINTPALLRGGFITRYKDFGVGLGTMMTDLFQPKAWEKWRRAGVLTEMDNLITNEFGLGGMIGDVLNSFGKVSEFMNRVTSATAAESNLKSLAKQGKLSQLVPELNKQFGGEAAQYGKYISDLSQFKYGIEVRPAAFDNPIGGLYGQYNTFAINQAELVADMAQNMKFKELLPDLGKAIKNGTTVDFLATLTQAQRGEMIRFAANAAVMGPILGLLGANAFELVGKSVAPTFTEGAGEIMEGISLYFEGDDRGAKQKMKDGVSNIAIPSALQPLFSGKLEQLAPGRKVKSQFELGKAAVTGEPLEKLDKRGKVTQIIQPEEATKRLFFGGRTLEQTDTQEQFGEIEELRQQSNIRTNREFKAAREILTEVRESDDQDAKIDEFVASGELTDQIMKRMNTLIEEEKLGITSFERSLKSLPVVERAEFILETLQEANSKEEKNEILEDMQAKGILTDSVAKVMNEVGIVN